MSMLTEEPVYISPPERSTYRTSEARVIQYTSTTTRLATVSSPGRYEGAKESAVRDAMNMMMRDLRSVVDVVEIPSPEMDQISFCVRLTVIPPDKTKDSSYLVSMEELLRESERDRVFKREYLGEFIKPTEESTGALRYMAEVERGRREMTRSLEIPRFIDPPKPVEPPKPRRKISIFEEELERLAEDT